MVVVRQLLGRRAVESLHENFGIPVALGDEGDVLPVGRPRGRIIPRGMVGEVARGQRSEQSPHWWHSQISALPLRCAVKAMRRPSGDHRGDHSPVSLWVRLVSRPPPSIAKISPLPARSEANNNVCGGWGLIVHPAKNNAVMMAAKLKKRISAVYHGDRWRASEFC